jgi:hypothetical protein
VIRFRYVDHLQPPAPFLIVSLRCEATGTQVDGQAAIIDPAADRTIFPETLVRTLGLVADGMLHFQGFTSAVVELPVYMVELRIHDFPPLSIRVALGEREPFIILGRDVLNAYRILLDGPQQIVDIHPPELS